MNNILFFSSVVIILSIFMYRYLSKFGVPMLLVFISLGMIFGVNGIFKIDYENYELSRDICSFALIYIIFFGGFGTNLSMARGIIKKSLILSSLGVIFTSLLTGIFSHYVLKIDWYTSFLIGSVLGSTDAASVFSILRSHKLNLKENELESSNSQLITNLSEIELIESLIVEFDSKINELTNSINYNTNLKKKLVLKNEDISNKYTELNEKYIILEKDIEKYELRLSNLKDQFTNLINRLCEEYSLNYESCEKKMELYKNESFSKDELKQLKEDLRELGSFSYDSIEEFEKVKNELEFQKNQEIDLQNSIEDINKIILKR